MAIYNYDTEKILFSLPDSMCNFKENDTAIIKESNKIYTFKSGKWEQIKGGEFSLSLREINASIFSQLPTITDFKDFKEAIKNFRLKANEKLFVFVNYQVFYITIFEEKINEKSENFEEILQECVESIGELKGYDIYDTHIEIWIKDKEDTRLYYLFPYEEGRVFYD